MPRGLRNNNPLNIRRSHDKWLGLSPTQRDTGFFQFTDLVYGYRAAGKLLQNYQRLHSLYNLNELIARWAPAQENNTKAYIARVARELSTQTGRLIDGETHLDLIHDKRLLRQTIIAMHIVENGLRPTASELEALDKGLSML